MINLYGVWENLAVLPRQFCDEILPFLHLSGLDLQPLRCSPLVPFRKMSTKGTMFNCGRQTGSPWRIDHMVPLSLPCLPRLSCGETCHLAVGRSLLASSGKHLVPCTSDGAHRCRSREIWELIKYGFHFLKCSFHIWLVFLVKKECFYVAWHIHPLGYLIRLL